MAFTNWVIIVPGFTQDYGTPTKLFDLWKNVHGEHASEQTCVLTYPWNSDWQSIAEFVHRMSVASPNIYVAAYSWGAGWGFTQLSKHLELRGRAIRRAFLIDPVYRHPYTLGQWRLLFRWWPISIRDNVRRVTWWRQEMTFPKGHELRGRKHVIDEPTLVEAAHVHMDDQQEILGFIERELKTGLAELPTHPKPL